MGFLSNDFVQIEYKNDYQRRVAEYYIKLFQSNPEFYKIVLNGVNSISASQLYFVSENVLDSHELDSLTNDSILFHLSGLTGARLIDPSLPTSNTLFHDISMMVSAILDDGFNNIMDLLYSHFSYFYFSKTNDISYLKKYLFDSELDLSDLWFLCDYIILNHFEMIFKEKIAYEKDKIKEYPSIYENLGDILKLVDYVVDDLKDDSNDMANSIHSLGIDVRSSAFADFIPKINDDLLEQLIRDTIIDIDPSLHLLDLYYDCKKEGKITIHREDSLAIDNSHFFHDKDDFGIYVSSYGNISDVISFMHEFGHLYYYLIDKDVSIANPLFNEYPSIYFEKMAISFLLKKGYSKESIQFASSFRTFNNFECSVYLKSILHGIQDNKDLDIDHFDLSKVLNVLSSFDYTDFSIFPFSVSDEDKNKMIMELKRNLSYMLFRPSFDIVLTTMYLIGSFISNYSIKNLSSEEVLSILHSIRLKTNTIPGILKMHGVSLQSFDSNDASSKSTVYLKDNSSSDL